MLQKIKISLNIPDTDKPGRYFSFRLKPDMVKEPSEFTEPKEIFAVSDIEGNFRTFCKLLMKWGIINHALKWTFGEGHLVIIGDCFDRGEEVTECLWLIYSLEEQARKAGGYVHFILGNHEIMNLNGDWRYIHPKYAVKHAGTQSPSTALYHGNIELWNWLRTKNIVERIGSLLFVHGGIAPSLLSLPISVTDINTIARPFYSVVDQLFTNPLLSIVFNSLDSPFWFRGYYDGTANENIVDQTLEKFKVNTIITGHTITEKVAAHFNGKVINVNTDHAGSISEGLLVRNHQYFRVTREGKKERIK